MFEHNFQDKAHVFINNEVFLPGTSEVYKTFLVWTDLLECVYLEISTDLKISRVSQGPDYTWITHKRKKLSSERVNSIITNRKSIHCIYSSLIETKI